jgi:hypothetical protein
VLFCDKSASRPVTSVSTNDARKIGLGGGYRLPLSTTGACKIRPNDDRVPVSTADTGKIRLGGGYRLPV